jgi:DNA/RNA endonuclease YhcR with UshA esterase domain
MRMKTAGWIALTAVLVSGSSLVAHHSLAQYETSKAVRVKGEVVLVQRMNPHSVIVLDKKTNDGTVQRWAVEGPALPALARRGLDKDFVKVGDTIEACGYVPKTPKERTINTEPISLSLKATTPKSVTGKVMDGELLTLADGKKQIWSDYGFHLCMDPDYRASHR